MKKISVLMKEKRAEGYLDTTVLILAAVMVIAIAVHVCPVYITKIQLDNFADELIREAEIAGRVDWETEQREITLREKTGLAPTVTWSDRKSVV